MQGEKDDDTRKELDLCSTNEVIIDYCTKWKHYSSDNIVKTFSSTQQEVKEIHDAQGGQNGHFIKQKLV